MSYIDDYRACMESTASRLYGEPPLPPMPAAAKPAEPKSITFMGMYTIPTERRASVLEIQQRTCARFKIPLEEMRTRCRETVVARQVAIYLARRNTSLSLPQLGRRFGGRDHTTILYSIRRIALLRGTNAELDGHIRAIEGALS